jgi:hypothetical protein
MMTSFVLDPVLDRSRVTRPSSTKRLAFARGEGAEKRGNRAGEGETYAVLFA